MNSVSLATGAAGQPQDAYMHGMYFPHAHKAYPANSQLVSSECCYPGNFVENFQKLLPHAHLKLESGSRPDGLGWWKFTMHRICRGCGGAGRPVCERIEVLGASPNDEYEKRLERQLFDHASLADILSHGIDLTVNTHLFNLSSEHCHALRTARTFEQLRLIILKGITWLGVPNSVPNMYQPAAAGVRGIKKMEYIQTVRYLLICKLILVCQNPSLGGGVFIMNGADNIAERFSQSCWELLKGFDSLWAVGEGGGNGVDMGNEIYRALGY